MEYSKTVVKGTGKGKPTINNLNLWMGERRDGLPGKGGTENERRDLETGLLGPLRGDCILEGGDLGKEKLPRSWSSPMHFLSCSYSSLSFCGMEKHWL